MVEIVEVAANKIWVKTPVWAQTGDILRFRANGTWVDAIIPCSADGYRASALYALNRLPRIPDDGRYFRLMGRIVPNGEEPTEDDPAATFPIGVQSERSVARSGRLFVFANDRPGYYWNNWGTLKLTVSKQRIN